MTGEMIDRARGFVDAYNRHDFAHISEQCAAEMTFHDHPVGLTVETRDDFRDWLAEGLTTFPDAVLTDVSYIADDRRVAIFCVERATHVGPLPTATGEIAGTDRQVEFPFCIVFAFDDDGLIVAGETYYDTASILTQVQ